MFFNRICLIRVILCFTRTHPRRILFGQAILKFLVLVILAIIVVIVIVAKTAA
jgi:hypothetical protein